MKSAKRYYWGTEYAFVHWYMGKWMDGSMNSGWINQWIRFLGSFYRAFSVLVWVSQVLKGFWGLYRVYGFYLLVQFPR